MKFTTSNPHDMLATVGGTRQFDTSSLTIMSLFLLVSIAVYRNHPMPNQIEAFKLAESTGMGNRRFVGGDVDSNYRRHFGYLLGEP